MQDFKIAVRGLMRSPGFTTVAVITLGLAIGACAVMFSVVDTVLLRALPYPNLDRLVFISATAPGSTMPEEFGVSDEFVAQYKKSPMIENGAAFDAGTSTLRTDDRVERVLMAFAARSFFDTLGVRPILGRLPSSKEDEGETTVISYRLWTTWFGSDPEVIGRRYEMAGARQVIGVMGKEFRFPTDDTFLWITNALDPVVREPGQFGRAFVAKVAPGVTTEALARELTTLASRLPEQFPEYEQYGALVAKHLRSESMRGFMNDDDNRVRGRKPQDGAHYPDAPVLDSSLWNGHTILASLNHLNTRKIARYYQLYQTKGIRRWRTLC